MKKLALFLTAGAAIAAALAAAPAHAFAPARVWVSGTGTDSIGCGSVASPCATFSQALSLVAVGGEISVLTPGDFGQAIITKAVGITNDGTGEAGIQVTSAINAVFINAGNGDVVGLRGLVIDGAGSGGVGVAFIHGSGLHVQNLVIRNFEGLSGSVGLLFGPSGTSRLFVSDSIIYNNGSGANSGGILIQPSTGTADVVLDRVQLENNVFGLKVDGSNVNGGGAHVIVRDSVFSGNAGDGLVALGGNGAPGALVFVVDSAFVSNTGNGILATGAHGTVLLSDSVATRNGTGISAVSSGQIISYQNNDVDCNGTSCCPPATHCPDGQPTSTRTQH